MKLPVIGRIQPRVTVREIERAQRLALKIIDEHPELDWTIDNFRNLMVNGPISDLPTLHLDDFSETPIIGNYDTSPILQQRARLRAGGGDWVALSRRIEPGYSNYCEYDLGLGHVHWLYPSSQQSRTQQIACECWQDRRLRLDLLRAVRDHGLRYIHPHISTLHVWELASLLSRSTRMPIDVIGPTPALTRWANDKIEFTRAAARLLGREFVPTTEVAYNFATLSKTILRLAATNERLCIKFPYGTGGLGNFVIQAEWIRGRNLSEVKAIIKRELQGHRWPASGRVLIDVWETNVLSSPSVQTWIPAFGHGDPIIEGLFDQNVTKDRGNFVGSGLARLPEPILHRIADKSYLLAYLFQRLGYVGRCSFDLILVGSELENCQFDFIECNARWGGTSIPMTLMNRLKIEDQYKTYSVRRLEIPGLCQLEFSDLHRELADILYNSRTGQGQFILINPARIKERSAIQAIAFANSEDQLDYLLATTLPARLERIVRKVAPGFSTVSDFLLGRAAVNPDPEWLDSGTNAE